MSALIGDVQAGRSGGTYTIFGTGCVALKGVVVAFNSPSKGILFGQSPSKRLSFGQNSAKVLLRVSTFENVGPHIPVIFKSSTLGHAGLEVESCGPGLNGNNDWGA